MRFQECNILVKCNIDSLNYPQWEISVLGQRLQLAQYRTCCNDRHLASPYLSSTGEVLGVSAAPVLRHYAASTEPVPRQYCAGTVPVYWF